MRLFNFSTRRISIENQYQPDFQQFLETVL